MLESLLLGIDMVGVLLLVIWSIRTEARQANTTGDELRRSAGSRRS